MTAAIGSATTIERNTTTKPRERAVALSLGRRPRGTGTAASTVDTGAYVPTPVRLAIPTQMPLSGSNHFFSTALQPPRYLSVDLEDAGPARVLLLELLVDGRHDRAEAELREDPLRLRGLREADEPVRGVAVLARLDDGDRRLDQQGLPRDDVLELRESRLVLVRDEDVAAPGDERVRRVAARRVERDDVLDQLLDERLWPACPVLPRRRCAPYAAITFHFAAPDESGFGVTIPTPGFTRSLQFLIFFGLPSRTAKTTIELVAMPLYDCLSQLGSTSPAFTRSSMSSPVESWTTSALSPAATARAWSPDAPYDWVKLTSRPSGVCCHALMTAPSASRGTA